MALVLVFRQSFENRSNYLQYNTIQLSPKGGGVNSVGYIPRREASRYISTALHRP